MSKKRKTSDFLTWRVLAESEAGTAVDLSFEADAGVEFDELVIGDGRRPERGFIHLEVMDDGHLWMDVCGVNLDVLFKRREVHLSDECVDDGWKLVKP